MGYQTGAAASVSDLLSSIQAFAAGEGWTVDSGKAARSDALAGECVNLTKGDVHGAFYSYENAGSASNPGRYMGTYNYPAYGAGGNMGQANASAKLLTNGMGSSAFVAHHLFGGPNHLHAVVETISGTFKHFGIGQVDKLGTVTTGVYAHGSNWGYSATNINNKDSTAHAVAFDSTESVTRNGPSLSVRCDSDGITNRYLDPNLSSSGAVACGWRNPSVSPLYGPILELLPSTMTGRAVLFPLMLSVGRGSNLYSPFGIVPDIRVLRMDNFAPGDAITIGSDTWRVFPVIRKNGTASDVNSGTYAYAYLQRP